MPVPDPLAALGPFFATSVHDRALGRPWSSVADTLSDGHSLTSRIEQVRGALAASRSGPAIEARVAASVTQFGLTARLVSPALGLAVLGLGRPVLDASDIYWQPGRGGAFPLSLRAHMTDGGPPTEAPSWFDDVLEGPVSAVVAATTAEVAVARAVLWGNVASALDTAARLIGSARPDLARRAAAVAGSALAHPLLRDAHQLSATGSRRRSCCLMYRVTGPRRRPRILCADCVLEP